VSIPGQQKLTPEGEWDGERKPASTIDFENVMFHARRLDQDVKGAFLETNPTPGQLYLAAQFVENASHFLRRVEADLRTQLYHQLLTRKPLL
jgi:hypothetical protein